MREKSEFKQVVTYEWVFGPKVQSRNQGFKPKVFTARTLLLTGKREKSEFKQEVTYGALQRDGKHLAKRHPKKFYRQRHSFRTNICSKKGGEGKKKEDKVRNSQRDTDNNRQMEIYRD